MLENVDNWAVGRRAFLQAAILLVGGTLAADPARALADAIAGAPRFFTAAEFALLDEVCALIIPATDTPGAREAGVPGFIDALMTNWAAPATSADMRAVLAAIDAAARSQSGKALLALTPAARLDAMRRIDEAQLASSPAYARFKELVLLAYYSSEAGATKELRYELVPGVWQASIPLKPGQPAWAV